MSTTSKTSILAVMCGVVAMTVIDLSVVNVALPSIQSSLHLSADDLQWVVVSYGVFVAGFLLLGGRAGDLAGHRRVLVAGIGLLSLASLAAGFSGSLAVLVAARAGQGLGAALAAPNALGILSRTFAEGAERNRALGIFGAAGGTAAIAGSVLGGLLVQTVGWQWVFFLNVPAGAALVAAALYRVPADQPDAQAGHSDTRGAVALTAGLIAVALGVHESAVDGWVAPQTLVPILGGLALLRTFVAIEARSDSPLMPLSILRTPSLAFSNLVGALLWASFLSLIYEATLFAQQVLGYSPLAAGASTTPIAVLSLVASARVAPAVIARIGAARTAGLGMALLGAGMLMLVRVTADGSYLGGLLPAYCVVGAGLGLAEVSVQIAAFAGVADEEAGLAGGAIETSRELGGALGLALIVSIALNGTTGVTAAFHHGVVGAGVLALASAVVAATWLRRAERAAQGPRGRAPLVAADHGA
jgi:EmrB/QacA subfamily drug resistance transporter